MPSSAVSRAMESALRAQRSALIGLLRDGVISQDVFDELGMEIDMGLGKKSSAPDPIHEVVQK